VVVDESLVEKSFRLGEIFRAAVRDLDNPLIKEVRGRGLFNAIVFDFGGNAEKDFAFSIALKEEGLVAKAARTNIFRFAPPLVITEVELLEAVGILGRTLKAFK
jgi:ornithine--oxo-acid transaminase